MIEFTRGEPLNTPSGIRPAAVSGSFYPADRETLTRTVDTLLSQIPPPADARRPKALIVPHAGYIYSGAVAACAYARLRAHSGSVARVVLLGPAHRLLVRGLALPAARHFATPLGVVDVDPQAAAASLGLPQVVTSDAVHAREHSLEVQLPFLQRVLGAFRILPFAVGDATAAEVAEVIELLWDDPRTVFVISTDLSHYLPYAVARATDRRTVESILALDDRAISGSEACGSTPLGGLLRVARARGLRPELLDLRNSGDTAGDREQVVGYAALIVPDYGHD